MAQLDSKKLPLRELPRPLAGKRILVTRARSQASGLARRLKELGGEVIELPTIEIQPAESYAALDEAIREIHTYDWLIFTSVNGVEQFFKRSNLLNKSLTMLEGIEIAAIGPETARAIEAAGLQCRFVPKQYQAEGLLDLLTPEQMRGSRVLIPRAAKAREVLPERLRQWGAQVDVIEAYRTAIPSNDVSGVMHSMQNHEIDIVTFTSSSTVTNFVQLLKSESLADSLKGTAIACIGPITQKTVETLGGRAAVVAEEFTIPGLVQAIVKYFEVEANALCHPATKDLTT